MGISGSPRPMEPSTSTASRGASAYARLVRRGLRPACGLPIERVALGIGIAILFVGLLGVAYAGAKPGGPLEWTGLRVHLLGLDNEWSIPAFFSGALLLAAASVALLAAEVPDRGPLAWALRGLGALFAFMAVDEVVQVHERLEALAGVPWTLLYLPVALAAGVLGLVALRGLWFSRAARACFIAGAGAWLLAQMLESYSIADERLVHRWAVLPEELLEMAGSTLFGLALLVFIRAAARPY